MVYVANDGRYIIKDRSITCSMDLPGNIEITYPMDNFECDDLLAPTIALLLQKGYTTKYCCQGHITPDHVNDHFTCYNTDIPVVENFSVDKNITVVNEPYIMFDENIKRKDITDLPFRWYIDKKNKENVVIRQKISDDIKDHYMFFPFQMEIINGAEEIYKWACSLPYKE